MVSIRDDEQGGLMLFGLMLLEAAESVPIRTWAARMLLHGRDYRLPDWTLATQLVSLVPIALCFVLVMCKRKKLPFPSMWTGVMAAVALTAMRRLVSILFLITGNNTWIFAYDILLVLVPVTMLYVAWKVITRFQEVQSHVDDLEVRYKAAMLAVEHALKHGTETTPSP